MRNFDKIGSMMTCLFFLIQLQVFGTGTSANSPASTLMNSESATYLNLYAAVQGETNASAAYKAFAAKAEEEGYPVIARLFLATADAEAKHADDEWKLLQDMGAKDRPVAEIPVVGTTAENLLAAFDGETYEFTVMYPEFIEAAKAEGLTAAERIFNFAMKAEEVHAINYADVLANLDDADYIEATYSVVYRCPTCGEVVTERPDPRCPICNASGATFAMYNATYFNLYASVQGETNASAAYKAFAAKAEEEGYPVIARLFLATADAEAKHAEDEWTILKGMGATDRPVAETPTVGTTAENLLAAFDGETYEYTVMYPDFIDAAKAEGMTAAERIFNFAMKAEEVHAINYDDVLKNLDDSDYIDSTYAVVFRCPTCGEVVTERPDPRCPICNVSGANFVMYNATYFNLYASVQGETNASAAYKAFAAKAEEDGYPIIAQLFKATADAEAKHVEDEWKLLEEMGATDRPAAEIPVVGTTAENLEAAFNGETYEYTVMYPEFIDAAKVEGMTAAERIFNFAMKAEEVHAINYADVLANLDDSDYIESTYSVVFRCPTCGEVVTERPDPRCPICNASGTTFIEYDFKNTGLNIIQKVNTLSAYTQNGVVYIKGLTKGQLFSIYYVSGELVSQKVAESEQTNINLPARGVYIVRSGTAAIKVVN